MDPKYCDTGLWEDKVIEESSELITELSELIKTIIKSKRFGLENCNPHTLNKTNRQNILLEMTDLEYALNAYKKELNNG